MASQTETALLELSGKFERMMDNIEIVKDKQEEMASDIVKIKELSYSLTAHSPPNFDHAYSLTGNNGSVSE